ncbi:MAG: DUF721 domain-containing protein [Bacteroidia bacterium]
MQKKPNHLFTIEEALKLVVSDKRIKKGFDQSVIKQEWAKIMGEAISKHTTGLYLNGTELIVYFNSSIVKNEVIYHKEKAINLINESLGYEAITDLKIK